jgi:segregation and condensation protein B
MTPHDHPRNDLALAEAALFLAPQPLTRRGLAKILGGVAQAYVDQLLEDLKEQFEDPSRGIELHIEDGRAQFRVKSAYVNEVAHLAPQHDIPRQELRTLAVIAYNHPMTQANLIKVRGNKGYRHVQELIERNLITSEPHGRTCLLHVTRDFLRHFGLSSVEEFRFHFPTAAEENAEALARGTQADDDHAEPTELDGGSDVPGAVSAEPPFDNMHQESDEKHIPIDPDGERTSVEDQTEDNDKSDSFYDKDADAPDPEESDDAPDLLSAHEDEQDTTESDTVNEQDTEPSEEVERG